MDFFDWLETRPGRWGGVSGSPVESPKPAKPFPSKPLSVLRWIAVRKDKKSKVEFYDWETLGWSKQAVGNMVRDADRKMPEYARANPVQRIVEGMFVEQPPKERT